ncbi:MAG: ankyrin repeat domain-containing protein [Pseudomonadota bacterium]
MDTRLLMLLGNDKSLYPEVLEARFPRVFNKIVELMDTPHIDIYLQDLMVDKRSGDRAGFPPEAAAEIIRLSNYLDKLHGSDKKVGAWDEVPEYRRQELENLGYEFSPGGLIKSVEENNQDAVQVFLSSGVDLEVRDERHWTPLMISSFNGNEDFALLLIKCGAKITACDKNGYNPLHWAAFNGYSNVIKLLIDKGANPNTQSQFGWTALMQAATRGHLIACAYLILRGGDVNLSTVDGWTALHKAANNGHVQVVKLLLDKGANRYAKYSDGRTALDLAERAGHQEIVSMLNPGGAYAV